MCMKQMRYRETGGIHLNFYGALYASIKYLQKNYGNEALREIFNRTGFEVYRSIHEKLKKGDSSELLEHWSYFLKRENGKFNLEEYPDGNARLFIKECPAVRHIKKLGLPFFEDFCCQTTMLNEALCRDTEFTIKTEKIADGSCIQTLERKVRK